MRYTLSLRRPGGGVDHAEGLDEIRYRLHLATIAAEFGLADTDLAPALAIVRTAATASIDLDGGAVVEVEARRATDQEFTVDRKAVSDRITEVHRAHAAAIADERWDEAALLLDESGELLDMDAYYLGERFARIIHRERDRPYTQQDRRELP
ncbi:MAG: hypothetical protein AAGD35_16030 [Actinomycetota bacterium]